MLRLDLKHFLSESLIILLMDFTSHVLITNFEPHSKLIELQGIRPKHYFIRSLDKILYVLYEPQTGHLKVASNFGKDLNFSIGLGFERFRFGVRDDRVYYFGNIPKTSSGYPKVCMFRTS